MTVSDLQLAFNDILTGKTLQISCVGKKEYEVARVGLLRKFAGIKKLFDDGGFDSPYSGKFLQCTWKAEQGRTEGVGTFQLVDEELKKRKAWKTYNVNSQL